MMDILIMATIILEGILLNFAQYTASDSTSKTKFRLWKGLILVTVMTILGILQYYSGALTSITCSTIAPSFLINRLYGPQQYDLLPEEFGIKAVIASDRSNVTLHVDGSTMAHNVTVECQNIIDAITGGTESMFQLTLLFTGNLFIIINTACHNTLIAIFDSKLLLSLYLIRPYSSTT